MPATILCLAHLAAQAQDSVYSHWPTVRKTTYDPAKRDALVAIMEKLAARPVLPYSNKAVLPARDSSAEWKQMQTARQLTDARDFTAAYRLTGQVLEAARQKKDQRLEMHALVQIGDISREVFLGASLKAVPYHEQALELAMALKDTVFMVRELIALADNYGQAGQNEPFLTYALQAAGVLERRDVPSHRMGLTNMCGCFLSEQGNVPGAEKMFRASLSLARQLNSGVYAQHLYYQLFSLYLGAGDAARAQAALDSARTIGPPVPDAEWHHFKYQLEKLRGNRELAFAHLEQAYRHMGDEYARRGAEQLAGWETRLRTHEKEIQLEEQHRQRRLLYGLALALAVLCAVVLYAYFRQREGHRKIKLQTAQIERQAAELRSLDEAKSLFFANVSHELRTPLTLILGPLNQALQAEDLPVRVRRLLELTRENGRHLLELVNQLLDLGRLDIGRAALRESPTHLPELFQIIVHNFQSLAASRGIDLRFSWQADDSLWVATDRDKVQKILNNLLGNALKFTPTGGRVEVLASLENSRIRISVTDTGTGIHPDDLPHIFERYYQSKQPRARTEGGFGIGLAYCRELAGIMGGGIGVESKAGEGSRFWVELPLKPEDAPAQSLVPEIYPPAPHVPAGRGTVAAPESPLSPRARLLIVEDHAGLQEYLNELLWQQFHIDFTSDGAAALHLLRAAETLPDLIISDVMMPVMDGFELLEALRADARLRDIPVILLTARAEPRDRLRAFRLGIDDYLQKPFEAEELQVRLENALRNYTSRRNWQEATPNPPADTQTDEADNWYVRLVETTRENLGNPQFDINDLAIRMGVGRKTLYRLIRIKTGLSVNQLLQELRLLHARELLENGQFRNLRQVSDAVGFRSADYFSRLYRARFGKSPADNL